MEQQKRSERCQLHKTLNSTIFCNVISLPLRTTYFVNYMSSKDNSCFIIDIQRNAKSATNALVTDILSGKQICLCAFL